MPMMSKEVLPYGNAAVQRVSPASFVASCVRYVNVGFSASNIFFKAEPPVLPTWPTSTVADTKETRK